MLQLKEGVVGLGKREKDSHCKVSWNRFCVGCIPGVFKVAYFFVGHMFGKLDEACKLMENINKMYCLVILARLVIKCSPNRKAPI